MQLPEPRWAVKGILPEGLSILAGKPKHGKSWLALNIAVAVATGGIALGNVHVERGDVLYLALEDTPRRLQDRLRTILSGGQDVPLDRLTIAREWKRLDRGGLSMLGAWLEEHPQCRLVVIDTFAKVKPTRRVNGSLYDQDYADIEGLKALADKNSVAVVVVHHQRKMGADDPLDTVNATFGLTAAVDHVLVLLRERGRHDAALYMRGRDIDEQELALKWDPSIGTWSIMGDAEEYRQTETKAAILRVLREAKEAPTPKQVAEALDKREATIRSAMWRMAQDGEIISHGGRYTLKV
jgi:hypothetical protein